MVVDPTMVVFAVNSFLTHPVLDGNLLTSWKHGPVKQIPCYGRGRPRKNTSILPGSTIPNEAGKQRARSQGNRKRRKYEFVNCTGVPTNTETSVRKVIRSHVMLNRRYQQDQAPRQYKLHNIDNIPDIEEKQISARRGGGVSVSFCEILGLDPFNCLPIQIQPYTLQQLSKYTTSVYRSVYCIEKYSGYNPMKKYFLPLAFQDPALLHAIIFCAQSFDTLSSGRGEASKAVFHLNESIRLVNQRLRSVPPVVDESTILVVATIAFMEKLVGNHTNWEIHMRGLKEMISLKGGLGVFAPNRLLTDLCGCIDAVRQPFFEDARALSCVGDAVSPYVNNTFRGLSQRLNFDTRLCYILDDVEKLTNILNQIHCGQAEVDPLLLRDSLTSHQYQLLWLQHSPSNINQDDMQAACCFGLLLYLTTILNELPLGTSTCGMLITQLRTTLEDMTTKHRPDSPTNFLLWLTFMICSMVVDESNKAWAMQTFKTIILDPDFQDKERVKLSLVTLLWVEKVHGPCFDRVWSEIYEA
ncbi:fungal-specific transcription factor domain-containing protein [Xylogone sp. PMI_703]|nr:fungal-specific transcription factor domain-containing protein [Xylogone sp. PMI_703]